MGLDKDVASAFLSGGMDVSIHLCDFLSGDSIIAGIGHAPRTHREWSSQPVSTEWLCGNEMKSKDGTPTQNCPYVHVQPLG